MFAPCLTSICEHVHPEFGGREPDETWNKTRRAVQEDHDIFTSRRHLWTDPETALEYRKVANR